MDYRLVLLETSGNQPFIFDTNKLGENVGASELTNQSGTAFVLDAVKDAGGPTFDRAELRRDLLNRAINKPIEQSGVKVEVIVASSGKALLAVDSESTGKKIVAQVTRRALEDAPGLDICGAVSTVGFDITAGTIDKDVAAVHLRRERVRSRLAGPEARFARIPVVDECATSGLPASFIDVKAPDARLPARSTVAGTKRSAAPTGLERMQKTVRDSTRQGGRVLRLHDNIDQLEKHFEGLDWLAVIHSDGNGIGGIFLDFLKFSAAKSSREYLDRQRRFSIALDICTERAFASALQNMANRMDQAQQTRQNGRKPSSRKLPVVPLVLGGDDMTVICEGRHALLLARDYLVAFEKETADPNGPEGGIVHQIARTAFGGTGRLSACAGIAIVKPHYPFHAAYDLADDLIQSAKDAKEKVSSQGPNSGHYPCSFLDFLIHHDSTGQELKSIRKRLVVPAGDGSTLSLVDRPYVVTDRATLSADKPAGLDWAQRHHWDHLADRVKTINDLDLEGRRQLPSSMLHELRGALFHGQAAADAILKLVYHRYKDLGLAKLVVPPPAQGGDPSFFSKSGNVWCTGFLDALDASDFLR